ncbi:L,D-transpeptidase family protein [Stappia sp. GBMRC 2046]|uniref:L,D-transpeptidase family protein n=1 Tax=Stappia sediminis TaxID=2692190 RepID=A0A7X3LW62_9HYPH|nr:L,D-transpeptidase [Stappia sediminis]MXN66187.1 L,D-transpeptidase family protein [Stappia sediminis]
MQRTVTFALAGLFAALAFAAPASADYRRASPPPLILSPDLTEPWVLQLSPRRGQVRPQISQRPIQRTRYQPDARAAQRARPPAIDPRFLPTTVAYNGPHTPGTIIVDTNTRYLYLVQSDGFARRYGVGVGRPGFEWAGTHKVTRKTEWPDWRPPAEMRERARKQGQILPVHMEGGPANPLGARALYLGSTLYRIHGSNEPWTIGRAVSSGCIRMRNEDVIELYERVGVGTKVIVI